MKRRSFVKTAALTGAAGSLLTKTAFASPAAKKSSQEMYELKVYTLKDDEQQKLVEDYLQHAALPELNRMGCKNIGVFTELKPDGHTRLFVLIPFDSAEEMVRIQSAFADVVSHNEKAAAYWNASLKTPAYERIESWLLQAFTGMPKMETPEKKERFFELRRYESPTEAAGKKKIAMFNEGNEIAIFKRLGFKPVFFSETLIGSYRPNLTYMITFDDMAGHDRLWNAFANDPDWKRISSMPEYPGEIVSRITSTFLVPTSYSQI